MSLSPYRDKLARHLNGALVEELKSGFSKLAAQVYKAPSNPHEADIHTELVDQGYAVISRGWPDFLVLDGPDECFMVEVKGPNDSLSHAQRVVLEILASKGIDVYVRDPWGYQAIGQSKPFWEHRQKHWK